MGYKEICNFVTGLGWKKEKTWANRTFYNLGGWTIVEHNGDWTIAKNDDYYFINADEHIIMEFTGIITSIINNFKNPRTTLEELNNNLQKLNGFYEKYEGWEDEIF